MNRDVDIMEHADGEGAASPKAEDNDVRAKTAAIRELGELVRGRLELAADEVADARFAAMWREIHHKIEAETGQSPTRDSGKRRGFWHSVGSFFDRYRAHILVGAVSAGAVAALALLLRPPRDGVRNTGRDPIDARAVSHRPAEIDDLDTPGGVGTVFNLYDEDGTTTVIWVTPEDTVEGI